MALKSLKIKITSYYHWDDMIYLDEFDKNLIEVVK